MNIANHALPTAHMHDAPRRMGRARSIVAIGPMLGLIAGGILADLFEPRLVFLALGGIALIAPVFAWRLPSTPELIVAPRARFSRPDAFSIWSFCMGFALDGLFVFGLSLLAVAGLGRTGVIAASVAMALRYLSEILFSPLGVPWPIGTVRTACSSPYPLQPPRLWRCWAGLSRSYGSA